MSENKFEDLMINIAPEFEELMGFRSKKKEAALNAVIINDVSLPVKEYNGVRVVTFKDIDELHKRPDGTAGRNFRKNRKYFMEGVDYFKVCADEIRRDKIADISEKAHEDVILLTESGYLMIVKSLKDNLAWAVQRELINVYFKAKKADEEYRSLSLTTQSIINLELANKKLRKDLDEMAQRFTELERAVKPKAKLEAAAKKSGITGKPWSEREKDFLRDAFQMGLSDLEIAAKLDRTEWAISNKRRKMDMYHANGSKHWTKAEVKKLKRLHGMGLTAREIGQIVGKTTSAVNAKVCKLRKDGKL